MAIGRFLPVLLANDYTVIFYDQFEQRPDKSFTRKIMQTLSPATQMEDPVTGGNTTGRTTNQIAAIYIEAQKTMRKIRITKDCEDILIICGISSIDIRTGKNIVGETYSSEFDPVAALQETYRFLIAQRPREVIIHVAGIDKKYHELYEEFLGQVLELERYPTIIMKFDQLKPDYLKKEYQTQFLEKIFSTKPSLTVGRMKLVITQEIRKNSIIEDLNLGTSLLWDN